MPAGSGRYPSGQRGQTVNLLAYAFGGSNPPLPTIASMDGCTDRKVQDGDVRGNSSAVERQPSKLGVAGSNPVSRSRTTQRQRRAAGPLGCAQRLGVWGPGRGPHDDGIAHVAQLAERVLGKDEVSGSNPDMGSSISGRQ